MVPTVPKSLVSCRLRRYRVNTKKMEQIVACISGYLGVINYSLALSLVGSRRIHTLNREFRGKDQSTDVLSFPQHEWPKPLAIRHKPLRPTRQAVEAVLGDVVISLPNAAQNAQSIGQSLDREVAFLLVHGMLHLVGYDHQAPAETKRMEAAQRLLIKKLTTAGPNPLWHRCVEENS